MELGEDDYDYYDVLNVTKQSSADEIKANYHKLIRQWHPDKNMPRPDDQARSASGLYRNDDLELPAEIQRDSAFNKIHRAYTVLADPEQRRVYDQYGAEGVNLKKLVRQQVEQEVVEAHTIEASMLDEETIRRNEEIRRVTQAEEVERQMHDILQKRRWHRFEDRPVKVITHFKFSAVTSLFDDQVSAFLRKKLFQISKSAVSNSVEIALSNRTRLGYTYMSTISRSAFGSARAGIYLSSDLTDSVTSTVSLDCGSHLNYNTASFSLKKMISEKFWVTSILSIDRYLAPAVRFMVHKSWASRHAVEIAAFPMCVITYGYNYNICEDLKVNLQTSVAPEDIGTLMRVKAMSTAGAVYGTTCKFSINSGFALEGYMRQTLAMDFLAKAKLECRLRFRVNSLQLIFKVVLNNTHIELPIDLYTGSVDYCVFLGTVTACTMAMVPVVGEVLHKMISPERPSFKREPPLKNRRHSFYSNFPAFSYLGQWWDPTKQQDKYLEDCGRGAKLMNKAAIWTEEMLETIVAREVRIAQQENESLYHAASSVYHKETDIDGLCIMFAVYGHPEAINRIEEFVAMETFENLAAVEPTVSASSTKDLELASARNFVYGSVTVSSILKQNNQARLQKLFDRYVIDVTNALMSRVTDSHLVISTSSKKQLIGFADTCANIYNLEPELFVCYRYKGRSGTIRLADSDPLVLPAEAATH